MSDFADPAVVVEAWATWHRVGAEADRWYDQDERLGPAPR